MSYRRVRNYLTTTDRFNRFGEALEPIHAGDEDVRNATVFEFGDDLHP